MTKTPMVSVVMPVYNAAKHLRQTIDSVLNQSLRDLEIICVDDGSSDDSLAILRDYAEKDSRLLVLTQPNLHAGVARNTGLDRVRGKYVIFLDADDFFEPNMLADTVACSEKHRAEVCIFDILRYEDGTGAESEVKWALRQQLCPAKQPFAATDIPGDIFQITSPSPWNKLYRTDYIRNLGIRYQSLLNTNDLYFTMSALFMAERIVTQKAHYVHYRANQATSLQGRKTKQPFAFLDALRGVQEELNTRGRYRLFENSFRKFVYGTFSFNIPGVEAEDFFSLNKEQFAEKHIDTPEFYTPAPRYADTVPSISVVIPVYNTGNYLQQCIDSVRNQTLTDLEIICVNDGSFDGSLDTLRAYAEEDDRIAVISQRNGGLSAARNAGLDRATGKYVYFLDSDDSLVPNAMELLFNKAEETSAEVVLFSAKRVFESDDLAEKFPGYRNDISRRPLPEPVVTGSGLMGEYLKGGGFLASAVLQFFRREYLTGNGLRFFPGIYHEDELFTPLVLARARRISLCPEPLYCRIMRENSIITQHHNHRHFEGLFVAYVNLTAEIGRIGNSDRTVCEFLRSRAQWMLKNAQTEWDKLSEEERSVIFQCSCSEYRQMYREMTEKPQKTKNELKQAKSELRKLRTSAAYRIGRLLTAIPRKIKKLLKRK